MRDRFDRLLVAMGTAMFCLSLLASLAHLSRASAVANQLATALSIVVVFIGLADQWYLRRARRRHRGE